MNKLLAAALVLTVFAAPAFAAKKAPKQHHVKYDYRYHTPKMKLPKSHNHQSHPHNTAKSQSH